jgi:hypothetical protein
MGYRNQVSGIRIKEKGNLLRFVRCEICIWFFPLALSRLAACDLAEFYRYALCAMPYALLLLLGPLNP